MSFATATSVALCFALANDGVAPEWVELIPAPGADGLIRGLDGRSWRMTSAETVAANFPLRLPLDINHSTELRAPKGEDSPAVGWIEELQARNGAVWGRVAWTESGAAALAARAYRFVSPVFTYDRNTHAISRLTSAALVNNPNLPLALNAAGAADPSPEPAAMTISLAILAALSLGATATESDAVSAINALKSSRDTALNAAQTPDLAKFVPRADHEVALGRATNAEAALNAMKADAHGKAVGAAIDEAIAAGKVAPASREFYVATCATAEGLEKFKSFVSTAPVVLQLGATAPGGAAPAASGELSAEQKALCAELGVKPETFLAELRAINAQAKA